MYVYTYIHKYIYIYMYIYMCIHMYVFMWMYIFIYWYIFAYMLYQYTYMEIHMRTYARQFACLTTKECVFMPNKGESSWICACVSVCVYISMCVSVCIQTYMYMQISLPGPWQTDGSSWVPNKGGWSRRPYPCIFHPHLSAPATPHTTGTHVGICSLYEYWIRADGHDIPIRVTPPTSLSACHIQQEHTLEYVLCKSAEEESIVTTSISRYGVATISRLLKIIGLFCKRALLNRLFSAKETYEFKELTNRSHPIYSLHRR